MYKTKEVDNSACMSCAFSIDCSREICDFEPEYVEQGSEEDKEVPF
jgi:hypothetical protein